MSTTPPKPDFSPHKKATVIVLAVLLTASVSGYFMGLQQTASTISLSRETAAYASRTRSRPQEEAGYPTVAAYGRLPEADYKPNAKWTNNLSSLVQPEIDLFATIELSEEEKLRSLAERASRRAFDGAPPRVPHGVDPVSTENCMACHESGLVVKDRIAPKMSHRYLSSCTQCHVPMEGTLVAVSRTFHRTTAQNNFDGLRSPESGSRAYPGAPPVVPHSTLMRTDCTSCHGPLGWPGLRTTHAWRQNCLQCHAVPAELNQQMAEAGFSGESQFPFAESFPFPAQR